MRDPNRIPRITAKLMQLWQTYPDMRLGQLIVNIIEHDGGMGSCGAVFNIEDDRFEIKLDQVLLKGWAW